jgi:hypothetical protein
MSIFFYPPNFPSTRESNQLKRKQQCLDRLLNPELHLYSSHAKHDKQTSQENWRAKNMHLFHGRLIPWGMLSFRNTLSLCHPSMFFSKGNIFCNQAFLDLERKCIQFFILLTTVLQSTNESIAPSCVLPWNLKERFHRVHVKEGRVSIPQFNCCDPQGPDVTTSVIGRVILLLTSNDLSDKSRTHTSTHCHLKCPKKSPAS